MFIGDEPVCPGDGPSQQFMTMVGENLSSIRFRAAATIHPDPHRFSSGRKRITRPVTPGRELQSFYGATELDPVSTLFESSGADGRRSGWPLQASLFFRDDPALQETRRWVSDRAQGRHVEPFVPGSR